MSNKCLIDVSRYKAILFDLDGVITDTMGYHLEAYRQAFERSGVTVTQLDIYLHEGMPSMDVGRAINKDKNSRLTEEQLKGIIKYKRELYRKLAEGNIRVYPGVKETLKMLRQNGILLALVTGSNRKSVTKVIGEAGLNDSFDTIVTGEDTEKGKPYADPYKKAMEKLGVKSENSVVVENAPLGIRSAKAANVDYVIGVTTTLPEQYLNEADDVMPAFTDVEKCLAKRLKKTK